MSPLARRNAFSLASLRPFRRKLDLCQTVLDLAQTPSRTAFRYLVDRLELVDDGVYDGIATELERALSSWPNEDRAIDSVDLSPRRFWSVVRGLCCFAKTEEECRCLLEGPALSATSLRLTVGKLPLDLRERFAELELLELSGSGPWTLLRRVQLPPIAALDLRMWGGELFEKDYDVRPFWKWLPESVQRVRFPGWASSRDRELRGMFAPSDGDRWRRVL